MSSIKRFIARIFGIKANDLPSSSKIETTDWNDPVFQKQIQNLVTEKTLIYTR